MKARSIIVACFVGALLGFSATVHAQGGFGPPELTLVPVKDDIYMIRNRGAGNVTVLVGKSYAMQGIGADIIASENGRRIMAERQTPGLANIAIRDYLRIYLDDLPLDLYYFGRGHTDNDIVIHLPTKHMLIAGDLFALYGPYRAVIDYTAGGSLRDWTRTLERVLQLDFDAVIPGHSGLTDRKNVEGYKDYLTRTQEMVREMNKQKKSRDDIQAMLKSEFNWGGLEMNVGLDGVISEMR